MQKRHIMTPLALGIVSWIWATPMAHAANTCGNSVLDRNEICDRTNLNGKACKDFGYFGMSGPLACAADCLHFDTSKCYGNLWTAYGPPSNDPDYKAKCGNQMFDAGEECENVGGGKVVIGVTKGALLAAPGVMCGVDCKLIKPSPTPTPTPTPTKSATPTPSKSPTLAPSATPTPTLVISPTPKSSPSPTSASTTSPKPIPTSAPTISGNTTPQSPSPSVSPTPTLTPTPISSVPIVSQGPPPAQVPSPSPSPIIIPSATPTQTSTPSFSATLSLSPTPTATPSFSATISVSATPSPTPTPSAVTTGPGVCGNGILEPNERCDVATTGDQTGIKIATSIAWDDNFDYLQEPNPPFDYQGSGMGNFYIPKYTCDNNCTLPSGIFDPAKCGDGALNDGELCDPAQVKDPNFYQCAKYTQFYAAGLMTCTKDCFFDLSQCKTKAQQYNNGVREPGELCDGADLHGQTCMSLGFGGGGTLACGAQGAFNTSGCVSGVVTGNTCGNNHVDPGEQGDYVDGVLYIIKSGKITQVKGLGVNATLFDKNTCHFSGYFSPDPMQKCGNNLTEVGEWCDTSLPAKPALQQCSSFYPGTTGAMSCKSDCTLDSSACVVAAPPANP